MAPVSLDTLRIPRRQIRLQYSDSQDAAFDLVGENDRIHPRQQNAVEDVHSMKGNRKIYLNSWYGIHQQVFQKSIGWISITDRFYTYVS